VQLQAYKSSLIEKLQRRYTVREAKQIAIRIFEAKLGLRRAEQVLEAQQELNPAQTAEIDQMLAELGKGIPIDYLLGETVFFGYDFIVDPSVLIPRPETEELVQLILERETDRQLEILDIGTGSGCIPIALKLEGKYKQVDACEVSEPALKLATKNAAKLKAEVNLFLLDILTQIPEGTYEVIVSNPPYVFKEELDGLDPKVVEYEPRIALSPEGKPLQFYHRILSILPEFAKPGARIYFEIHEEMGEKVDVLMRHYGLQSVEVLEDMYGRDRFAFGIYPS